MDECEVDWMPQISVNDVTINYHSIGSGEPIILIAGLGLDHMCWLYQIPFLQQYFKVIVFDNRGIGKSSASSGSYSIKMMADDTIALLKSLGIYKAHVLGYSMGGMIAQEIAINYPEQVKKLILCSTFAKHQSFYEMIRSNIKELLSINMKNGLEDFTHSLSFSNLYELFIHQIFSEDFLKTNFEIVMHTFGQYLSTDTYVETFFKQLYAIYQHDTIDRLPQIASETMILAGDSDTLVPLDCAKVLANNISQSSLNTVKHADHVFHIEQPDRFNHLIFDFLSKKT